MRQVTVETVISAPREQVFDFVGDLSLRPSFADHYLKDFRLANANPVGKGAAARFLLDTPVFSERGGLADHRVRPPAPDRRGGRGRPPGAFAAGGRVRLLGRGRREHPGRADHFSEPGNWVDRIKQTGVHRWVRRQSKKALRRLKEQLEEPGRKPLKRVTVAGYESVKAPRFGAHVPVEHETAPADG